MANEPSFSVSPAAHGGNDGGDGINFTVDHALTREESVYRPRIARGYRPSVGWTYGVLVQGQPVFGSFERVAVAAEAEWSRIQAAHGAEIARDFALVDAIDRAETERGVCWP